MKTAGLLIGAALAVFGGAATAAPDPSARARLAGILDEFNAISDIDIGNCDHEYPAFAKAYAALTESPDAVAMHRALAHFDLEPQAPAKVEHEPTADQCLAALDKAKALFERHGDYIQQLAANLPPPAAD
ncbi:MAG: hypothetical protein AMXMBFR59_28010 [Rhodanobacteraceae bacterium]